MSRAQHSADMSEPEEAVTTAIVRLRGNGQLTLPASLRRLADLKEGDAIEVQLQEEGSILLKTIVVMDRLQADLLLRLQLRDIQAIRSSDLQARARDLARTHEVALTSGDKLDTLVEHFHRGHLTRPAFISHLLALGLPPSAITTLLTTRAMSGHTHRAGTLPESRSESRPSKELRTVRISQAFQSLLYLPLYIAYDVGFFDEEGVSVEIETAGGGPESWATVLADAADYSIHDPVFAAAAYERGVQDAVVVATICNGQAILAAARSAEIAPTTDPRHFMTQTLSGRTVATQPAPDSQWAVLNYLGFLYGVKMGEHYQNLQVPIGTEMRPVLAGQADIGTAFPPAADIALSQGLHEIFDFSRFFGPFLLSALCTRRTFLHAYPETHQAVINALEKACQYAYAYPEEAIKIAQWEFPGEDPEVIAAATYRSVLRHFVPEHVYVDAEAWRENQILHKFVETLDRYHEPVELVDNEASLHAYRALGHLRLQWCDPRPIIKRVATAKSSARKGED